MIEQRTPQPLHVLLVEDNEHDTLAVKRAFANNDPPVDFHHVHRGEEALERLGGDGDGFDVVVTDYSLPGMSGVDLSRELIDRRIEVPLVILTGSGSEHTAIEALKAGAYDYVIKDPDQGYLELLPVVLREVAQRHQDRVLRRHAEEAFKRSEERLRGAIESMQEGFVLFDAEDRLVMINDVFRRINPRAQELLEKGMRFEDLIRANVKQGRIVEAIGREEEFIRERLEQHRNPGPPIIRRFNDGRWHILKETRTPEGGTALTFTDVTGLKHAEQALRESEEQFKDFAEAASDWFWEMDETLRFTFFSGRRQELTGLPPDENIGETRWEVAGVDPDKDDYWREHRATLEAHEPFRDFEFDFTEVHGKHLFISVSGKPVFDEAGVFKGYRGTATDITVQKLAETKLRESEERLRRAVIDAPIPIMIHAEDGEVLMISQQWTDLTGYTHAEIPTIAEWTEKAYGKSGVIEESRERIGALYDIEEKKGEAEYNITTKSGEPRTWDFRSSPLGKLPDGRSLVISMAVDVTERKRAEDELRDAQQTLSGILMNLPGTIFRRVLKPDGELSYEYSEGQLFADLGLERADGDGLLLILADSILPEDEDARRHAIEESAKTLQPCEFQFRVRLPTGQVRWIESRSRPFPRSNGEIVWDGLSLDITERKQAEEAVKASEARLAGILHIAPEAVIAIGEDLNIRIFNQGAERIFGYDAGEVMGRSLDMLLPARMRKGHRKHIEDFSRSPEEYRLMSDRGEIAGLRKDGTEFPASASVSKLEITGEKIFTVSLQDVTERKRAEEELLSAKREAEHASRAKSEFLAAMSHDLRTPLNAILGFADILNREYFGPLGDRKYQEYAEDIRSSGEHLLALVNDLLDISSIEAGKQFLAKEDLSIQEIIAECMRIVGGKAQSDGIHLAAKVPEDLPLLRADRRAAKQILLNLLSNAVKFTPAGGKVTVSAKASKRKITLRIADTGKGIPTERLPNLTDPFTRIDTDPYLTEKGWGLGLTITKSLVDLHDGEMEIKSKVGKGTTVTVTLPNTAP